MRLIKYSFYAALLFSFTSCLKAKSDVGGILTDQGQIVTSVSESQYINTDLQNIGFHFTHASFANFDLSTPGTESVKFFTIKVTQARDKKMSGDMTVKFSSDPVTGYDPLPAGAVTFSDLVIPANSAPSFEVPVFFTVNKTLLNPANFYAVHVDIETVSQGVVNQIDGGIEVIFNPDPAFNVSPYTGRYQSTTTIVDSADILEINNNTRPYILSEGRYDPFFTGSIFQDNLIYPTDLQIYGLGSTTAYALYTVNKNTGAQTALFRPVYRIDNTGKVIDVLDRTTLASLNPVFDASSPNRITVGARNDQKRMDVKYRIRLTASSLNRWFDVTETYLYDKLQVLF